MSVDGIEPGADVPKPDPKWVSDSLFVASGVYRRCADGSFYYRGKRPAPAWHAHGTTPRQLAALRGGEAGRIRIHKQRWLHRDTGETCHSRPPDDVFAVRACTLVVVLKLWAWLSSGDGVLRCEPVLPDLDLVGSPRTVQRWLARALSLAADTEHALLHTLIDKSEPRPVESLMPGGRSPPRLSRWRAPAAVRLLSGSLATLLLGASRLQTPTARLLAGARRRWTGPAGRFLL